MTLPMAVMICLFAPLSGRLVGTTGPRLPLVAAGLIMALAAGLLLRLSGSTPAGFLLAVYALFGIAFGLVNAPIANTAISGMPNSQAGVAASVASASRQTGSALGVAITGSLVAGASGAGLASASHAAWALLAACGLAVAMVGFASTSRRALATADRVREILAGDAPGTAVPGPARGTATGGDTDRAAGGAPGLAEDTGPNGDTGTNGDTVISREARARGSAMEDR
jgi:MFS family permease